MVFLLLSFQYQFKDKYFDAANLRLPHGVPSADEYLRFLGLEPIDIRFSLRDHSEGLPYKFVGDSNDRHLAWLAVRPQTVETGSAFLVASERRTGGNIELASQGRISIAVYVTFEVD